MNSIEKLVKALEKAGAPDSMIMRAKDGVYNEIRSRLAFPIVTLSRECVSNDLKDIALRAQRGEFDATSEEWDEYMRSNPFKEYTK